MTLLHAIGRLLLHFKLFQRDWEDGIASLGCFTGCRASQKPAPPAASIADKRNLHDGRFIKTWPKSCHHVAIVTTSSIISSNKYYDDWQVSLMLDGASDICENASGASR